MDQLSIQTIQGFLSVPLIAPEAIHDLDAKELAVVLTRLDAEADAANEEAEDAWNTPIDETHVERLEEMTEMLRDVMAQCERCTDDQRCDTCERFAAWIAAA